MQEPPPDVARKRLHLLKFRQEVVIKVAMKYQVADSWWKLMTDETDDMSLD